VVPAPDEQGIADIAMTARFFDVSCLNRLFRVCFGDARGQVRRGNAVRAGLA
jgi:uncharacterized protein (UPF0261 family)